MAERLLKADFERGKAVILRDVVNDDGTVTQREIEIDIPVPKTEEVTLRKYIIDDDGHRREEIKQISLPVFDKGESGTPPRSGQDEAPPGGSKGYRFTEV